MSRLLFMYTLLFATIFGSLPAYQLSIATIFQNEAPYLKEWIEYHRMVGVQHFWLYNDASTDNWAEVLAPYIEQGIVEVTDWASPTTAAFISYQCMANIDAIKKARGVSKWLALIDTDEFLLPAQERTVTECLNKHFANAAGVYINWHHFGTGGVRLKPGQSMLFTLTACSDQYHPSNKTGKSIVRPECIRVDDVWNTHHYVLESDKYYCNGDGQQLSFAGLDLKLDGKIHNKFMRINHYRMRDENFFYNVRLERTRRYGLPEWLLWQHYHEFNKKQDSTIIQFMHQKHPGRYQKWQQMLRAGAIDANIPGLRCRKGLGAELTPHHS